MRQLPSRRPTRLRLLPETLQHAQAYGDVWIATGQEIAERYARGKGGAVSAASSSSPVSSTSA